MKTINIANETKSNGSDSVQGMMTIPRSIVAMPGEFPAGHIIAFHQHVRSQLLYASSGVMTVTTDNGIWIVPPFRAIWIPAQIRHQIKVSGHLSMRTLYIEPKYFPNAPKACSVVAVSPLLKELILHAVSLPQLYPFDGPEERIMKVILDQIHHMNVTPLSLPIPKEARLRKIFLKLSETPGDKRTLEE